MLSAEENARKKFSSNFVREWVEKSWMEKCREKILWTIMLN